MVFSDWGLFAVMASKAYKSRRDLEVCGYYVREFDIGDVSLIVGESGTHLVFAIAGTDSFQDWWKYNLVMNEKVLGGCAVHAGFADHSMEVADIILDHYGWTLKENDLRVSACGHSLGGAVASCLPLLIPRIQEVRTFGAPRFMRAGEQYPDDTWVERVAHVLDLVPDTPLRSGWGFTKYSRWSHVGGCTWIGLDGLHYRELSWWQSSRRWLRRLKNLAFDPLRIVSRNLRWHNMDLYLSAFHQD